MHFYLHFKRLKQVYNKGFIKYIIKMPKLE